MSMPGIGVIGPGAIADLHAQALQRLGVPIVAVAGPRADDLESYARRHQVPGAYSDATALLADPAVDAVIVAAPSPVHAELSRAALHAGKPVLCEVPLALDVDEARQLVALAAQRGLSFGVAHTLRYWEPHRRLAAELAASGDEARHVVVRSMMLRQTDAGWTGKQRDWTDSAVWHHGSHAVDAALWFLGEGVVQVDCVHGPEWTNGSIMDAAFHLRTIGGRIAAVDLSYHSRRAKGDYLVVTESATWEINGATLLRDDEVILDGDVANTQTNAIVAQDDAFIRAIRGETDGFFSASDALPTLEVLAISASL